MRGPNNIDWKNEIWDAQRLVREFVTLAAWEFRRKPMKDLVWSDQIFYLRIIAVIHAFVGDIIPKSETPYDYIATVFGQGRIENRKILENSPIDEDDMKTIMKWLLQWRNHDFQTLYTEKDLTWSSDERSQMLHILLIQRFAVQKCLDVHDGMLECGKAGDIAFKACEALYNPYLKKANEQLDKIIALLLGSSFKGSFTVIELMEKHQYPKATDDEVFDWEIDNF